MQKSQARKDLTWSAKSIVHSKSYFPTPVWSGSGPKGWKTNVFLSARHLGTPSSLKYLLFTNYMLFIFPCKVYTGTLFGKKQ